MVVALTWHRSTSTYHGQLTTAQKDAAITDFERDARVLLARDVTWLCDGTIDTVDVSR